MPNQEKKRIKIPKKVIFESDKKLILLKNNFKFYYNSCIVDVNTALLKVNKNCHLSCLPYKLQNVYVSKNDNYNDIL